MPKPATIPTIPNDPINTDADREQRQFELSYARTAYNYMTSYLPPVPLSADEPKTEGFTLEYETHLAQPFLALAENFTAVVLARLEAELEASLAGLAVLKEVEQEIKDVREQLSGVSALNIKKDIAEIRELAAALERLPAAIKELVDGVRDIPKDLANVATGLARVFGEVPAEGATAFLKDTLYDVLGTGEGATYLLAHSLDDYVSLFATLPLPQTLCVEPKDWMELGDKQLPWDQDWYFGYMQIAGFNTTLLARVTAAAGGSSKTIALTDLLAKFPVDDATLQRVSGDPSATLASAAEASRLYVCDYTMFDGAHGDRLHGRQRFVAAPIALFYWNPSPPPGFPPDGAMQPVAIQLGQTHDPARFPVFTPQDGAQWVQAKYYAQWAQAVQHEAVAHFGACHAYADAIVVATHRRLPATHPLFVLLTPHFRFTIAINDSALHSLIVPGGTVASVLSPTIGDTFALIKDAHMARRFDADSPPDVFSHRGVDAEHLPEFPFRDDTLLIWAALERWVRRYLRVYYPSDAEVVGDDELQGWVEELAAPDRAALRGLDGLERGGSPEAPTWRITSFDYLVRLVAQIIYLGGPQHASVNYAQFPLMTYIPSVSGSLYAPPPTASDDDPADTLRAMPPLDVALYQLSFAYLLSSVQYDNFGHYSDNPRAPYFADVRVREAEADFKADLCAIEQTIRARNKQRPMPYPYQLPSHIPNSISI